MDLVAAIQERRSVRRYESRSVPKELVQQVTAAGRDAVPLRPEIEVRWYTVWSGAVVDRGKGKRSGTRVSFGPAPHYILGVSQRRPGYMANLGFCMEQLVLAATALGLGTCWIRGRPAVEPEAAASRDERGLQSMFDEGELRGLTPDIAADEQIVAITPLGYAETSRRAQMARRLAWWGTDRLDNLLPLRSFVSLDTWAVPWTGQDEGLNEVLELTRLAPSWEDAHPWHFVVGEESILAAVRREPMETAAGEAAPYCRLDGGIAMCHLYLAAQASGRWASDAQWRTPDEKEMARLRSRYSVPADHEILGVFPTVEDA
jgi:nitroreductase